METAALFIARAVRKERVGSLLTVFANQTRREMGLDDPQCLDSGAAVKAVVGAVRILIRHDQKKTGQNKTI